jgi:undecaprenyl diphosphate synthase
MDGNGRWAQKRGLPRALGHRSGVESLRNIVTASTELGVRILTVYALSTENWKRPPEEIRLLMGLLCEYIEREVPELRRQGVHIRAIGRREGIPSPAQQALLWAEEQTAANEQLILNIAINYGGRSEIVDAARELCRQARDGLLVPSEVDEQLLQQHLYTKGLPDPDLLIRTAGDLRVSNFLLWQIAYTEFITSAVNWPDFREAAYLEAIVEYQHRQRRFGGL